MKHEIYKYQNSDIDEIIGTDIENSTEYVAAGKYMIYLMNCALHGQKAKDYPKDCSWEMIYQCITDNNVQGLTHYAVEGFLNPSESKKNSAETNLKLLPKKIQEAWSTYLQTVIYKQLMMTEEREEILSDLHQKGFSFLMLKGNNIAKYYPKPGMRDMSDNDILYGTIEKDKNGTYKIVGETEEEQSNVIKEGQKVLLSYMHERGYETDGFYMKDDTCIKEPMYVFEMHRALMDSDSPHLEYYKNPWKWAVKNDDSDYKYHYPVENEYIYMLAHEFKHYSSRGCGIRFVSDMYVFLKAEEKNLDWDYIEVELGKLNLVDFERHMKELSKHVFDGNKTYSFDSIWDGEKLTADEEKELLYMCKCGTFGIDSTLLKHRVKDFAKEGDTDLRRAKRGYYWTRIFPPDDFYKKEFPFFYKHKVFRPFLTIYRFFKGIFTHFGDLVREVKIIQKMK